MTRKMSFTVTLFWLMSAPALAQNPADTGISPQRAAAATQRLADFTAAHGVSAWPRLDGNEYDRTFSGTTVGLILDIDSATEGRARWDGRSHVPMRHELTGVPPGLAAGRYVVAATSPDAGSSFFANRRLKIIGVLGRLPGDADLLDAALTQICTPVAAAEETDYDCRDRRRSR